MNKVELLAVATFAADLNTRVVALERQTSSYESLVQKEESALATTKAALKQKFSAGIAEKILEIEGRAAGARRLLESHLTEISDIRAEREPLEPALKRAEQLFWLEGLAIFARTSLERSATLLEEIEVFMRPRVEELEELASVWRVKHRELNFWYEHHKTFGVWNSDFVSLHGVLESLRGEDSTIMLPTGIKHALTQAQEYPIQAKLSLGVPEPFELREDYPLTAESELPGAPRAPERDLTPWVNRALGRTETPWSIPEHVRAAAARVGRTLP